MKCNLRKSRINFNCRENDSSLVPVLIMLMCSCVCFMVQIRVPHLNILLMMVGCKNFFFFRFIERYLVFIRALKMNLFPPSVPFILILILNIFD
jgi:hypothetical protein